MRIFQHLAGTAFICSAFSDPVLFHVAFSCSTVAAPIGRFSPSTDDGSMADSDNQGENVDFCSACGDQGKLLCCDGCIRSFHFKCLDPPVDEEHPPEGRWFCHNCNNKRQEPHGRSARGLFTMLEHNLAKQNPVAFSLPKSIREYYEGVGTGEDGEYEEVSAMKTRYESFTTFCKTY